MWWGYSPALDLINELDLCKYKKLVTENSDNHKVLNVLLIGAGDGRHIIKTLAQSYRRESKPHINFYIYEASLDLVARQVMLLTIALEPPEELGLQEKTRLFLELYGNTLIRPTTANFIARKAVQFVHMVTDLDFQAKRIPLLHLDQLKYRERDYLENVFKFWQVSATRFPVTQYWDKRLRKHLGTRYDSRNGIFDWDYHMRLRPQGGKRITSHEYKQWRRTGTAFTWLETETTEPNLTLATGAIQVGDRLCHHGYLGDIVTGPFLAYGLNCEDKDMLRDLNGTQAKRTTEIAERNVMRIMHELLHHQPFVPTRFTDSTYDGGIIITEVTETHNNVADDCGDDQTDNFDGETRISKRSKISSKKETYSSIPVDSAEVIFLPISAITDLPKKEKFKNFFDVITVSQNMTQHITEDLMGMACDGGLLVVESKLFLLDLRNDDLLEFGKTLNSTASACNCISAEDFNPLKDVVAKFTVKKNLDSELKPHP